MEIVEYKDAAPGEKHIAEFSIYFEGWGMTFKRWKLRRSSKGHLYVNGPVYGVEEPGGEKKFFPYIEFSKDKKEAFEKKLLQLLEQYAAKQF